jgi:hypothetical protein
MTRTLTALGLGLALACAPAFAQTPQTTKPTDPQKPMSSEMRTITVTGCLKTWTGSTTSSGAMTQPSKPETGKPAETAKSGAQYVLSDITTSPSDTMKPSPSTTAGSTPATSYLLMAKDSTVNLSQHLNHKVTVSGTVGGNSSSDAMAKPSSPTTSSTPDRSSATGMSGQPATLTVTTLTMVSATCSPTSSF